MPMDALIEVGTALANKCGENLTWTEEGDYFFTRTTKEGFNTVPPAKTKEAAKMYIKLLNFRQEAWRQLQRSKPTTGSSKASPHSTLRPPGTWKGPLTFPTPRPAKRSHPSTEATSGQPQDPKVPAQQKLQRHHQGGDDNWSKDQNGRNQGTSNYPKNDTTFQGNSQRSRDFNHPHWNNQQRPRNDRWNNNKFQNGTKNKTSERSGSQPRQELQREKNTLPNYGEAKAFGDYYSPEFEEDRSKEIYPRMPQLKYQRNRNWRGQNPSTPQGQTGERTLDYKDHLDPVELQTLSIILQTKNLFRDFKRYISIRTIHTLWQRYLMILHRRGLSAQQRRLEFKFEYYLLMNRDAQNLIKTYHFLYTPIKNAFMRKCNSAHEQAMRTPEKVRFFHKFLEDDILLDYTRNPTFPKMIACHTRLIEAMLITGTSKQNFETGKPQETVTRTMEDVQLTAADQMAALDDQDSDWDKETPHKALTQEILPAQRDGIVRHMANSWYVQPKGQLANHVYTPISFLNWETLIAHPSLPYPITKRWKHTLIQKTRTLIGRLLVPNRVCIARSLSQLEIGSPHCSNTEILTFSEKMDQDSTSPYHKTTIKAAKWIILDYWTLLTDYKARIKDQHWQRKARELEEIAAGRKSPPASPVEKMDQAPSNHLNLQTPPLDQPDPLPTHQSPMPIKTENRFQTLENYDKEFPNLPLTPQAKPRTLNQTDGINSWSSSPSTSPPPLVTPDSTHQCLAAQNELSQPSDQGSLDDVEIVLHASQKEMQEFTLDDHCQSPNPSAK
jgi:hypothetical protein